MNNEFNQNTRTLIVSFALALMVMVPLRFVEIGNQQFSQQPSVLGDSIEAPAPRIEAPYDVVEQSNDCLENEYVDQVVAFLKDELEIANFESRRCR